MWTYSFRVGEVRFGELGLRLVRNKGAEVPWTQIKWPRLPNATISLFFVPSSMLWCLEPRFCLITLLSGFLNNYCALKLKP